MAHMYASKTQGAARAKKLARGGGTPGESTAENLEKWAGYARSNAQSTKGTTVGPDGMKTASISKKGYTGGAESGVGRLENTKRARRRS